MPNLTSAEFAFQDSTEVDRRRIVLYPFVSSMDTLQNQTSKFPLLIAQVSYIELNQQKAHGPHHSTLPETEQVSVKL